MQVVAAWALVSTGSAARIGSATVRRSSVNSTTPSRGGSAARNVAVPVTGTKLTRTRKLAAGADSGRRGACRRLGSRMSILDTPIARLDGSPATLGELTGGRPGLLVNVASRCGLTPQYAGLEQLQETSATRLHRGRRAVQPVRRPGARHRRGDRGVLLRDVRRELPDDREGRGQRRGPPRGLQTLVETPNEKGDAGDITWNFEKFLLAADGKVVARFSPGVEPDDPRLVDAMPLLRPEQAPVGLADDPFDWQVTAAGPCWRPRGGRHVVTVGGTEGARLAARLETATGELAQQLLARATGNYKRGEREAARLERVTRPSCSARRTRTPSCGCWSR